MNANAQPKVNDNLLSDTLRNVAMVAEVNTSALGLTRTDKQASSKAVDDHAARAGSARVVVSRLPGADDLHREIVELQKLARNTLNDYTTVWGQSGNGRRLLPNANFEPWVRKHAQIEKQHGEMVKKIIEAAPELVARAKHNLGTFDIDPPTVDEIANAYRLKYRLEPLPSGDAFKGTPQVEQFLKSHFERSLQAAYATATTDALTRLQAPLSAMIERFALYDEREQKIDAGEVGIRHGIFRDSLVENVQQMVEVFRSFNLTNDPAIESIAAKLDVFMKITPKSMKESKVARAAVAGHAAKILNELDDMLMPGKR